jgi:hypothetical protein
MPRLKRASDRRIYRKHLCQIFVSVRTELGSVEALALHFSTSDGEILQEHVASALIPPSLSAFQR